MSDRPILLSLGSNIDPLRNLRRAVAELAREADLVAASPVYRSAPVGAPGTPEFLNAAVEIATDRPPRDLKWDVLRPIESRLGRVRTDDRNAPRPIDLDLALYGDRVVDDRFPADGRGLRLPDADILRFLHAARPLADIAGDLRHPTDGRSLGEIAASLATVAEAPLDRLDERLWSDVERLG